MLSRLSGIFKDSDNQPNWPRIGAVIVVAASGIFWLSLHLLSSASLGTDIPDVLLDIFCVIKSFVDKRAAAIFAGYAVRDPRMQIQKCARATLLAIDAAKRADDLHLRHVHTYGVLDTATKTGDDHADPAPTTV
jgi:hypothetical protein